MCVVFCSQLSRVKQELSRLQATVEEEKHLAAQHQLALQAQVNEAHARIKVRMIISV